MSEFSPVDRSRHDPVPLPRVEAIVQEALDAAPGYARESLTSNVEVMSSFDLPFSDFSTYPTAP